MITILEEFLEAQNDHELHVACMAKTLDTSSMKKSIAYEKLVEMSIDDAINWFPGLSNEQLRHIGAPAKANKNPAEYLDYFNIIKENDKIDMIKFCGDLFQPKPTHLKHIKKPSPFLQKA